MSSRAYEPRKTVGARSSATAANAVLSRCAATKTAAMNDTAKRAFNVIWGFGSQGITCRRKHTVAPLEMASKETALARERPGSGELMGQSGVNRIPRRNGSDRSAHNSGPAPAPNSMYRKRLKIGAMLNSIRMASATRKKLALSSLIIALIDSTASQDRQVRRLWP